MAQSSMLFGMKRLFSSSTQILSASKLTESLIPTYHFQPSLPRLKIPPLDQTCAKYLDAVEPLISAEEFAHTSSLVQQFRAAEGADLDRQLRSRDADRPNTSYISDPWFDMYLSNPDPLPINCNPFLMFKEDPNATGQQTTRAAALIYSSLRFHYLLSRQKLQPEVYHTKPHLSNADWWPKVMNAAPSSLSWYAAYLTGAYPLDMSQFKRLFASSRIPGEKSDELTAPFPNLEHPHIVVIHKGHFFKVSALHASPASLRAALDHIVASAPQPLPANQRVATLTSERRREWHVVRKALIANHAENAASLADVDSALFVVCLDHAEPATMEQATRRFLCDEFHNRWFDKSFQLIVTPSGRAAVNFEHAWGDGVAVMRYFNEVFEDSKAYVSAAKQPETAAAVQPLQWHLCAALKTSIAAAHERMQRATNELNMKTDIVEGYGRRFLKACQVSPDAAVQMAFQLAYWRMHNDTVATYESASTSGFRFGRTETIRTVSHDSVYFVRAMGDPAASNSERRDALLRACRTHANRSMAAVMGNGFDRHLFALKYLAQEVGVPLPQLYKDPAYATINHNILSTSTLVSDACEGGGFGPVVPHGYGVGYAVLDDFVGLNISNFTRVKEHEDFSPFLHLLDNTSEVETDAAVFIQHVRRALSDIAAVLDHRPF